MNTHPGRWNVSTRCWIVGLSVLGIAAVAILLSAWPRVLEADDPRLTRARGYRIFDEDSFFRRYEDLRQNIFEGPLGADDLPRFTPFIHDESLFARVGPALDLLATEPRRARRELYAILMKAPPDAQLLYDFLVVHFDKTMAGALDNCRSGSIYGWNWAYGAEAALEAYEATGQVRFLDLVGTTGDLVIADRDDRHGRTDQFRGRVLESWGHCSENIEAEYTNVITHAGRITYPLLRYAEIVRADKTLEPWHGLRGQRFLDAAAEALDAFDDDYRVVPGTDAGYYLRPVRGDVEPLNHAHAAARSYVLLHVLTGEAKYQQRVEELAAWFRAAIVPDEQGVWNWPYAPTPDDLGQSGFNGEEVCKAQITIGFPVVAAAREIAFDGSDIAQLVRTFLVHVHRDGRFNMRIDPEFTDLVGSSTRHPLLAGWIQLDEHAPEIREIIIDAVADRRDVFTGGWFGKPVLVLAYAHRLAPASDENHHGRVVEQAGQVFE